MSSRDDRNTTSYATFSASSTSYSGPGGTRAQHTYTDPSGTTVTDASQRPGERPVFETTEYPRGAAGAMRGTGSGNAARRIEDVSDEPDGGRGQ